MYIIKIDMDDKSLLEALTHIVLNSCLSVNLGQIYSQKSDAQNTLDALDNIGIKARLVDNYKGDHYESNI